MKKILKIILIILGVFAAGIMCLAVIGSSGSEVSEETESVAEVVESSENVNEKEQEETELGSVSVEEKITQMVKEINPDAEVGAIVERDPVFCAYEYKEKAYVVYNMPLPNEYLSEDLLARVEQLETENTCDYSSGYLVFLNEKEVPDYFVESDSYKVFKLKCSLAFSGSSYSCYPFVDDEMILSYSKLFQDIKPIYEPYVEDVLSKQYTIEGEVIERDIEHAKLYLYGTATRYDGEEVYSGKMVLNYEEEGIDVTGDSIQTEGFFNMDDYGTIEEDGYGYRIYNASGASVLGLQLESLLNNVEYCEKSIECLMNAESLTNEENGNYEFDIAWYETCGILKKGTQTLEIIWYDNGEIDLAIDGLTLYHGNRDSYIVQGDGTVVYTLSDGSELRYYPNDKNAVQLVGGEYQGYYYPE